MTNSSPNSLATLENKLAYAQSILTTEANAILDMAKRIDNNFNLAIEKLMACRGKVVVIGIGKSGHIANKIAATLASTGTSAFFVHPAELRHGDFGMLTSNDLAIILSSSGETSQIKRTRFFRYPNVNDYVSTFS